MLHLSLLPDHARWADFFFRALPRRGRRGARLPRRVRLARRHGAAAAAAAGRALRRHTPVVPRQRHGRQPGRARDAADRPRRSTVVEADAVAARRASSSRSGTRRSSTRRPGARRSALARGVVADGRGWSTTTSARSGSRGRGAPPSCSPSSRAAEVGDAARRARASSATARATSPRTAATIERAARRRRAARVASTNALELGIDIGGARRRRADRLPGHPRLDVAAGGARRAGERRTRSRSWSRRTTRSTSTSCITPRTCSTAAPRRP